MRHSWSDNVGNNIGQGSLLDNIAAGPHYSPDAALIDAEEYNNEDIIKDILTPTNCNTQQRYVCLSDALRLLKNQMTERDALIFIARFYFRLKLKDLEGIFRLDLSNISRVAQRAERKLKVRG